MTPKFSALLLLVPAAWTLACGADSNGPGPTGGKTNWLSECSRDLDCEDLPDALCENSQCTRLCDRDDDCGELGRGVSCDAARSVCVASSEADSDEVSVAMQSEDAVELDAGMPVVSEDDPSESSGDSEEGGVDDSSCESNTLDPNQGNPAPASSECAANGEALQQGHDSALAGPTLEVEPLVGSWISSSDEPRIELLLDAAGNGMLRFGQATDYPEPTAEDTTFLTSTSAGDANDIFGLSHLEPRLGFGYTIVPEVGQGSEMAFHILTVEAWDPWCALQTPVYSPYAPECYACVEVAELYSFFPSSCGDDGGCFASDRDPSEDKRVDCGRIELCAIPYNSVCACNEEQCFANVQMQGQLNWYPYEVQLDPVDTTLLRLRSLSELREKTTYYLQKVENP